MNSRSVQALEAQNTDLTNSQRELLDVIARINSTTRKLFAETFEQVRANFREMFGELFRGGRADLSLLDENDPLNCGIEITAKPPGKQLQSVSLLSGGERAMTAVALLFAIYMVRPSPFCILDEVDAPLDETTLTASSACSTVSCSRANSSSSPTTNGRSPKLMSCMV
jgi:chromosome segregation protein